MKAIVGRKAVAALRVVDHDMYMRFEVEHRPAMVYHTFMTHVCMVQQMHSG